MYNFFKYTSWVLVLIGAINWGLVGAFNFDLVAYLLGDMSVLSRIVYVVIGLSAIVSIIMTYFKNREEYNI